MHESEKSDAVVVAVKPANKAERSAAEPVEPRTATKGNAGQQSTRRAQDRESVSRALERVRQAARQRKKERFTALLHHIGPAMLRTAFYAMKRDAAPGVDGMTWETYEEDLDRRIEGLHARVKSGAYRALPSRRSYIPKEDGSKRPLAVAALEDKIVQRATAAVLSAIFEEDFLALPGIEVIEHIPGDGLPTTQLPKRSIEGSAADVTVQVAWIAKAMTADPIPAIDVLIRAITALSPRCSRAFTGPRKRAYSRRWLAAASHARMRRAERPSLLTGPMVKSSSHSRRPRRRARQSRQSWPASGARPASAQV